MSLVSLLSIARSALLAQRRAMEITGHNIANANTPGYHKQRLELVAAMPQWDPLGTIGRGVDVAGVTRLRDQFFDASYRSGSGLLGGSSTRLSYLERIEVALGEPSDHGVSAALDGLFQSFSDLAQDPAGGTSRTLVREAASGLVRRLHDLDARLSETASDAIQRVRDDVASVNRLAGGIASLNAQILSAGPGGSADLADQRDVLVDQLSELVGVRVTEQDDGSLLVHAGDAVLVEGGISHALAVSVPAGGGVAITTAGGTPVDPGAGRLKALADMVTNEIPAFRAQLDQFVSTLVTELNARHRTGWTLDGRTGVDFFDPAGVTAGTIELSADLLASTDAIAAGTTNAPGDASLALALSQLGATALPAVGNRTLGEFYTSLAGTIGAAAQQASFDVDAHGALADHANAMRRGATGVSVDEEMVDLIGQQQAYGAAARLVQVAQDSIDTILRMI